MKVNNMLKTIFFAAAVVFILPVFGMAECIGPIESVAEMSGSYLIKADNAAVSVQAWQGGITGIEVSIKGIKNSDVNCQLEAASTDGMSRADLSYCRGAGFAVGAKGCGKDAGEIGHGEFSVKFASSTGKQLAELKNICWDETGKVKLTYGNSEADGYYGLGEPVPATEGLVNINYQGRKRTVWNKHWPPADLPINFFINPKGYALFIDNSSRAEYDFTNKDEFTWETEGGRIKFYVIDAPSPKDAIVKYTALTGRPPMPPLWSLGFMQSKYGYKDEVEFESIMAEFRKRKIPADAMIFDIDWQGIGGMGNLEWNPQTFPDAEGFLKRSEANGFKTIVIVEPYAWTNSKSYMEARKDKLFCRDEKGRPVTFQLWGRPGSMFDFCNPDTSVFWQKTIKRLHLTGIDGWWTDLNEPDVDSDDMFHAGKTPISLAHNIQPLLMVKSVVDSYNKNFPDERPMILSRSGNAGIAKYGTAMWSGDVSSTYQHLKNQIPIGISAGLSGMPLWGTDMGGFNGTPGAELFVRWFEFGLFNPIYRAHGNHDPREPWAYGPEPEKIMKGMIELRYRMLPHLYSVLWQMHETGLPPMRPLFLEFPRDAASWNNFGEYMFGQSILSAPVVEVGEVTKNVYLPPAGWYDFKTDKMYRGPIEVQYNAPLDTLPLFVRAGSVIAMGPVIQHTGKMDRAQTELHIFPGETKAEYELYEDDGATKGYLRGEYAISKVTASPAGKKLMVSIQAPNGKYPGLVKKRNWKVVVHGDNKKVKKVMLDGKAIKKVDSADGKVSVWSMDKTTGRITVIAPSPRADSKVEITLAQ